MKKKINEWRISITLKYDLNLINSLIEIMVLKLCSLFMISFNIKLNRAIRSRFLHNLHNDIVFFMQDLHISENKKKT